MPHAEFLLADTPNTDLMLHVIPGANEQVADRAVDTQANDGTQSHERDGIGSHMHQWWAGQDSSARNAAQLVLRRLAIRYPAPRFCRRFSITTCRRLSPHPRGLQSPIQASYSNKIRLSAAVTGLRFVHAI